MKSFLINGIGFDSHSFSTDRKLVLGGVTIPHHMGLKGHSDADALCHAIIDAILGASGEGDIGELFPDSDPKLKDANSIVLLKQISSIIERKKFRVVYIDAVIISQGPKLSPYKKQIRQNIASALGLSIEHINIKAKTNEGMGFIGRGEGLAVMATATVERSFDD